MDDNQRLLNSIDEYKWIIDFEILINNKSREELYYSSLKWFEKINAEIRGTIEPKFIRAYHADIDSIDFPGNDYGWNPYDWDKIMYIIIDEIEDSVSLRVLIRQFFEYPSVVQKSRRWWCFLLEEYFNDVGVNLTYNVQKRLFPHDELNKMRGDIYKWHPKDDFLSPFPIGEVGFIILVSVLILPSELFINMKGMVSFWIITLILGMGIHYYPQIIWYRKIQEKKSYIINMCAQRNNKSS